MASAYFPRLYATFPRPKAAFASSRRAAAWSTTGAAARARAPPAPAGNHAGSVDVTSAASAAAVAFLIALTLHARCSSWNIRLRCSFTGAYRFHAKRPGPDVLPRVLHGGWN